MGEVIYLDAERTLRAHSAVLKELLNKIEDAILKIEIRAKHQGDYSEVPDDIEKNLRRWISLKAKRKELHTVLQQLALKQELEEMYIRTLYNTSMTLILGVLGRQAFEKHTPRQS